jgi:hypothetical protein
MLVWATMEKSKGHDPRDQGMKYFSEGMAGMLWERGEHNVIYGSVHFPATGKLPPALTGASCTCMQL